jgi:hypothetical protein
MVWALSYHGRKGDAMTYRYIGIDAFVLEIPEEAVLACSCPGSNDSAVAYWVSKIEWPKGCDEVLRKYLKEFGAWTSEQLANDHDNRERVLWIAAGDISDEKPGCLDDET